MIRHVTTDAANQRIGYHDSRKVGSDTRLEKVGKGDYIRRSPVEPWMSWCLVKLVGNGLPNFDQNHQSWIANWSLGLCQTQRDHRCR